MQHELKRVKMALRRRLTRRGSRRFHCYCVGAAKTGTTSVAAMFSRYRTQHEPDVRTTNRLVLKYLEGEINEDALRARLKERDRQLGLELESSHPLGYLAGTLAAEFPDARFIITIREPLVWLRSRLNFHHKVHPAAWAEYREYFWARRHKGFAVEEQVLKPYGLCSLDTYLSQYAEHYDRVLSQVPEERRLVVRTSELSQRSTCLATFMDASPSRIRKAHSNRVDDKITPLDEMDPAFVRQRVLQHCEGLIERFFPQRLDFYREFET